MTKDKIARIAVYDSEDLDGAVYEIPAEMIGTAADLLSYVKKHGKKVCEFDSTLVERRRNPIVGQAKKQGT